MTKSHLLETEILRQLEARGIDAHGKLKTICPSEVARAIADSDDRSAWEPLMDPVRTAAERLVKAQKIVVTQRGKVIDSATAKGPVRLRLR